MNPDVTCVFGGRLGNTMFQAAALIAYARRYGLSWAIPGGYLWGDIYRFNLPTTVDVLGRLEWQEPYFHYTPVQPQPPESRYALRGFFQSWRYFDDARDAVRTAFTLPKVARCDAISVHVRRTDFVNRKHKCWNALGLPYYANATRVFTERGQTRFLVFSDDIKWCRPNVPACNPRARWEFCDEPDPVVTLALMAACAGHVIANSTLSWWGAWLGTADASATVVAPNHRDWFGEDLRWQDTSDLYPPGWTEVETC